MSRDNDNTDQGTRDIYDLVLNNYLQWKGNPERIAEPDAHAKHSQHLSPRYALLEYTTESGYNIYCTVGASYKVIPHSEESSGAGGVRFE